jgi:NADP-dependent 3-hydroxy acid dehydrogenase YdfG
VASGKAPHVTSQNSEQPPYSEHAREDRLDAIVKDITPKGGKALAVTVDVTKREQVDALIQAALKAYGKVDVLVNNAGINAHRTARGSEGERMGEIAVRPAVQEF